MKKLLLKVKLFLIAIVAGEKKFEKFLLDHADPAIAIMGSIKTMLNSNVVKALVLVLPAAMQAAEAAIIAKINKLMDEVAKDILIGEEYLKMTPDERYVALIKFIKTLSPAMQESALAKMASRYAQLSSEGLFKGKMADTAVQNRYLELTETIA